MAKLSSADFVASHSFGGAVAFDGGYAAVGAPSEDAPGSFRAGAVHVFKKDGAFWVRDAVVREPNGELFDGFGGVLAIQGEVLVVGVPSHDGAGSNTGEVFVLRRVAGLWVPEANLAPPELQQYDVFGGSVAIHEDRLAVGAIGVDNANGYSGAVYVYEQSANTWSQTARLTAPEGESGHGFGAAVALTQDELFIGASGDNERGIRAGAVFVYGRAGDEWVFREKLLGSDSQRYDSIGGSLAVDEDTAILGGRRNAGYVFRREPAGWIEEVRLIPQNISENAGFGSAVDLHGDVAVVGASEDDDPATNSGSAFLFRRVNERWTQEAKLTDPEGGFFDFFASTVALHADRVLVGTPQDDDGGPGAGSATIYHERGGAWLIEAKLPAIDVDAGDLFGAAVGGHQDLAVVGAPQDRDLELGTSAGSVHLFRRAELGYTREARLTPSDGQAMEFGHAVGAKDDRVLVGAPQAEVELTRRGAAYLFRHDGTAWVEEIRLIALAGSAESRFGASVALESSHAVIGSPLEDSPLADSGMAYAFSLEQNDAVEFPLLPSDPSLDAHFGAAVTIAGERVVVGAPGAENGAGAAYVFRAVGNHWEEDAKLTARTATDGAHFGYSVHLHGDTILVGAPHASGAESDSGACYLFAFDGSEWHEDTRLIGESAGDLFGHSVSLVGNDAIVGSPGYGPAGAAYRFVRQGSAWVQVFRYVANDSMPGVGYGASVSAVTDHPSVLIGAPGGAVAGVAAGAAFARLYQTEPDCNGNQTPDSCDLLLGVPDCNTNGVPDECDLASGASLDTNHDAVPDECQTPFRRGDANIDGILNVADPIAILDFQFCPCSPPPRCWESVDADDDNAFNGLLDALFLLSYLYIPGSDPLPPPVECGLDSDYFLGCGTYRECR